VLNLYYGRESIDKDRFMFDNIAITLRQMDKEAERNKKILLLVPDQYTLQAERNAFAYLGVSGLIDLDILSQSRLGYKVLEETGGSTRIPIDKYGRHMLLNKILDDESQNLQAFKGMNKKHSFIDMTNNLISEMKQFNTRPEDLPAIIEEVQQNSILGRKLTDLHRIFSKYEELIKDKYIDSEDYLNLFVSKIGQSELVREAEIWVSGFDYLTPKALEIMEALIATAKNVNIVITCDSGSSEFTGGFSRDRDLFDLTRTLMYHLRTRAEARGIVTKEIPISHQYNIPVGNGDGEKSQEVAHLEQELYAYQNKQIEAGPYISLCRAANIYAEAETAASRILHLVRDKGLRYKDIVVICNDMDVRGSVIKRVFADYGISTFLDTKRNILHNPIIEFITAILDIIARGWLYEDVFRLLKTNLTGISTEEVEALENYVVKYRIRGKRWKSDFTYGIMDEGEEALAMINKSRKQLYSFVCAFEDQFKKGKTAKEKTSALYYFLRDEAELPEKIEALIEYLTGENLHEYAEETAQIWGVVVNLLDQLVELLGDEPISNEDFSSILRSGFEAVEIGLLPPTIDQIIVGTMQRTRTGNIKALLVLGANDGLLPSAADTEGLLSEDEKATLLENGIQICKIDDLRAKEERLAIYKSLSKPLKYLWMSYSASDIEGKESKQSLVFDKIRKIFKDMEVTKDILNLEDPMLRVETPKSTLKYLTETLRNTMEGEALSPIGREAYRWYQAGQKDYLRMVEEGFFFTNKQQKLEGKLIDKLYKRETGDIPLSPSRLERFSRCPFAHFVHYGLKPEERRVFEIAGREIGDVYHYCIMKLSEKLTLPGIEITDPESPWMKITREECQAMIDDLIDQTSQGYREGVLIMGEEEKYRGSRMKEVCGNAAWALIEHVQAGRIQKIYFETEFGKGADKAFPPIEVKLKNQSVFIEGKIDRVDIIRGHRDIVDENGDIVEQEENEYVKIIDYKSGKESFRAREAVSGWRLQLMLYLHAATERGTISSSGSIQAKDSRKPAGVFYFEIAEPQVDATSLSREEYEEKVKAELKKNFKLDGVVLNQPSVVESIAGEFSGFSQIIPVRKNKDGKVSGTTEDKLLSEEEFVNLQREVEKKIEELCQELATGSIHIRPKKLKDETACRYCSYKSVCFFDLSFEGCSYEVIK
jgi:ATP-dependent helicase/nuclease subunit B